MSLGKKVVCVGPAALDFIFDPIVAGLRQREHEVVYYTGYSQFERESAAALANAGVLVAVSNFPCTRELMACAPQLRALVSPFIGTEGFDEAAATALGIIVANGQVAENFLSMAEATILLILASLYSLHWWEQQLRDNLPHPPHVPGRMLNGRTVGMIGFGHIARAMAHRLHAWEVRLQTYVPRLHLPLPNGVTRVELDELLRTSDVVCVLASLNAETHGMLDLKRLRLMKPDALLINTARGGIIDEQALAQIAGERPGLRIALDTFAQEPLPIESPLRALPNVILTPHAIGHTQESLAALPPAAIESVSRVLRGELPLYVRNPEVIPEWTRRWSLQR
ncbi:MAG: 2-hydroxyacid dehydrogenase [Deltaproteobacteria bacterium]|nr:2-hydroxyacid dehydrogenase [Deltaproteobacteria bacterium]